MRLHRRALLAGALSAAGTATTVEARPLYSPARIRRAVERRLFDAVTLAGERAARHTITEALAASNVPGLSLAVVLEGEVILDGAYGFAFFGGPPLAPETRFPAAQLSETVTALVVLALVEQGRLDLDVHPGRWLGDYRLRARSPEAAERLTLRRLLAHDARATPGAYLGYPPDAPLPTTVQSLRDSAPANCARLELGVVEPGRRAFSSGGFTLVQHIVETATGEGFAALASRLVLDPAGMTQSAFAPPAGDTPAARGQRFNGEPVDGGWTVHPELAAAGLWSTPRDMGRLLNAIHRAAAGHAGGPVSPGTARAVLTPVDNDEGLGLSLHGGGRAFGRRGRTRGFAAELRMHALEQGLGLVVMTNAETGPEVISSVSRAVLASRWLPPSRTGTSRRRRMRRAEMATLAGRYDFGSGVFVDVTHVLRANELEAAMPWGRVWRLTPTVGGGFTRLLDGAPVWFEGEVMRTLDATGRRVPLN